MQNVEHNEATKPPTTDTKRQRRGEKDRARSGSAGQRGADGAAASGRSSPGRRVRGCGARPRSRSTISPSHDGCPATAGEAGERLDRVRPPHWPRRAGGRPAAGLNGNRGTARLRTARPPGRGPRGLAHGRAPGGVQECGACNAWQRVEAVAAARLQAQLRPLWLHVARPGSASAGKRQDIAAFDVIPAGSSSDVCPDQGLRRPPSREQAPCAMPTQSLLRNWPERCPAANKLGSASIRPSAGSNGSKMPSAPTEPTPESFSSKSGMETQLSPSESPKEDEENPKEDEENPMKNPFTVPSDINIFSVREKERRKAKAERERMKTMKVHEKMTYSTKAKAIQTGLKKALQKEEEEEARKQATDDERRKIAPKSLSGKLHIKNDYPLERTTFCDYINNQREIFYLEYSMAVMREKMQKMDSIVEQEERKLKKAQRTREKDAAMFHESQKEKLNQCCQAIERTRKETAAQAEKTREILEINSQIEDIKSDILRMKRTLREHKLCRDFLYELSPKEWQEKHVIKGKTGKYLEAFLSTGDLSSLEDLESEASSDGDEPAELYFTDPQQVLSVLTEMEEKILSFIQNSQGTNTAVEKLITECVSNHQGRQKQLAELKQQVDTFKSSIAKLEEKKADLMIKAHLFSPGEHKADEQDKMLESLEKKVREVYQHCTGESGANLQIEQMLMVIEKQVYDLQERLESIPPEKLKPLLEAKRKEWRLRLREERLRQQKKQEEERLKKILEKSQSAVKIATGKRPMFRSKLPAINKQQKQNLEQMEKEKEEQLYYFT
ncbi:cilia- and flagella-associated protein 100 [Dryobates pubescens]|uniref:cilia- and flagella-associated protein 100 n=1 Tax=Dryobates pubescens TaxID=118200 RepID=UPI0023B97E55|nr:cilia- and flagella-associated protein 100 [Dryobates pubescens]